MKPRLPRGMFQRPGRSGYYTRQWIPDPRRPRGGREKWISLGRDPEEAKRKLERLRFDGIQPDLDGNVRQWAKRWLDVYIAAHRTPKGVELARTRAARYLMTFLGSIQVRRLSQDDLLRYRRWLESLEKPALKIQTIAHLLADAKCFALWLYKSGVLSRAPVPDRLLPRVPESPPRGLTKGELDRVCSVPDPHGLACRVMAYAGLRWSELVRLQASDLSDGALLVHGPTKSRRMRRVPLPQWLVAEIRGRVGRLTPFSEQGCGSFSRTVRRLSEVEGFSPHRLRHTFAYEWLAHGGSVTTLQKALGHADLGTAMRYGKPDDELVAQDAAKVNAARVS